MIRTGKDYRNSIRDGREVHMNGERIRDVATHPAFKPIIDIRARIYDMAHEPKLQGLMTLRRMASASPIGLKLPFTPKDWEDKRKAVDAVMWDIGGIVTRVGDETIGEMWSLWDGKDILNEIDPRFAAKHRETHSPRHQARSLPCVRQYRSQGRPLQAPAGSGPRHAGPCREGNRCRHHYPRRQV